MRRLCMQTKTDKKIFYGLSIANVIVAYLVTFGYIGFLNSSRLALFCFCPAVMGIVNLVLILIRRKHLDRTFLALVAAFLGYTILLGVAPFSVAYIIKSYKDKVHRIGWVILGIAAQLFSRRMLLLS